MLSLATLVSALVLVPRNAYSSSRVTGNVACKLSQNLHHQLAHATNVDVGLSIAVHATDSAIAHISPDGFEGGTDAPPPCPSPVFRPPLGFVRKPIEQAT